MAIKYRFKPANATNPNAIIESFDEAWIKNLKATYTDAQGNLVGGLITAVSVTYFVANDPASSTFENWQEANDRKFQLQDETFYVDEFVAPIDPQPAGLND